MDVLKVEYYKGFKMQSDCVCFLLLIMVDDPQIEWVNMTFSDKRHDLPPKMVDVNICLPLNPAGQGICAF